MNAAKVRAIFERLREATPDPRSELDHRNPFELLVSVVLSAQATDKSVNKATAKLYAAANTPRAIADLGVEGLIPYINSIGLFRNKAKNVVALCEALLRDHGGEVPADRDALEKLPGVGRKSAGVVLNVGFHQPVIPVDTHIFRVSNRTGLAKGKDPDAVADKLERIVPDEFKLNAHHWLILHGRYVCVARKPLCPQCVIREQCEFRDKTPPAAVVDVASLAKPRPSNAKPGAPETRASAAARKRASPALHAATLPPPPSRRGVQPLAKTARAATRGPGGGRKR